MKRLCLLCLATLLLAGCGASGGLYLPDQAPKHDNPLKKDPRKAQTPPASPAPSPDQAPDQSQAAPEQTTPTPQP